MKRHLLEKIKPYLGTKAFYKKMIAIAVPISLQGLITIGVNMTDTVMLSGMGEIQLSGSALANQFISLFQTMCMGMGMGASVLTSRYWGMKDIPSLKKAVTIMLRLCLFISSAFALVTFLMPAQIMAIYSPGEPEVIAAGVRYFNWSIASYLLLGFSLTTTIVLRSVGQVRLPLVTSIAAFFINVFANWVFIFGNLGAPRMEIAGAAVGTLICRIFECAVICGYFLFKDEAIFYRLRDITGKCGDMVREYFTISIPVLVSDTLLGLGNSAVAMVVGRIGPSFVAANAITTVAQQIVMVFTQGMSNASAIITGHTLGEGDVERAQREGYTFLGLGAAIGMVAGGFIMLVSGPLVGMYDITGETRAIAEQLMLGVGFIAIFMCINSILTKGVLRGGGDTKFLMVADILFLWIVSVPLGYAAGLIWRWPPFWIYFCLKIDQVIKAVWCVFRLRSRKWIKKI